VERGRYDVISNFDFFLVKGAAEKWRLSYFPPRRG
jgi:hypothetical protein